MEADEAEFFNSTSAKSIFVTTHVINQSIGNLLYVVIIWHGFVACNKNGRQKTLITTLTAFLAVEKLLNRLIGANMKLFSIFYGKLAPSWCHIIGGLNAFYVLFTCLTLNEIVALRYLYICKWKNVGLLLDDFFSTFLPVVNLYLSALFSVASRVMKNDGMSELDKLWCHIVEDEEETVSFSPRIALFTVFIHLFLFSLIYKQKRRIEIAENAAKSEAKVELITNIAVLLGIMLLALPVFVVKRIEVGSFGSNFASLLPEAFLKIGDSIFLPLVYISKCKSIQQALKRKFRRR